MSKSLSRQALLGCTVAALVATVGSFHTPTRTLNANNVGAASRSRSSTAPTSPSRQRRGALRDHDHVTASRRGSVSELNNAGAGGSGEEEFYTPADLEAYSKPWGITLHYRGTLNTYRIEAHRPNGEVAGYTTGFYLGDLLHLDKVQVCALSPVLCPCQVYIMHSGASVLVCSMIHQHVERKGKHVDYSRAPDVQ